MKFKFSQFDDEGGYDASEPLDDMQAWEEGQVHRDTQIERQEEEARHADELHVTVYFVERTYGGPEEGGWWYDRYSIEPSSYSNGEPQGQLTFAFATEDEAKAKQAELQKQYPYSSKELSSVLGRGTHEVIIEDYVGEYETKTTPHYE